MTDSYGNGAQRATTRGVPAHVRCTACFGFGEAMVVDEDGTEHGLAECPECDGYGWIEADR